MYSSLTLLASLLFSSEGQQLRVQGALRGWTLLTMVPIVTYALGGIIVGLVMKHAGAVQKGFAIMGGIVLTGFV